MNNYKDRTTTINFRLRGYIMILKNGKILVINDNSIKFIENDIRIRDSIIGELGENLIPDPGEESIDLNGDYILPGMVNSHYHSYTNILRGTSFGEPLELWSPDTVALGKILSKADMVLSTSLGICEMLRAGVTTCLDHLPHLGASHLMAKTYEDSGFKSALAPMLHNVSDSHMLYKADEAFPNNTAGNFPSIKEYIDYYTDFVEKFHNPDGNVQVIVGINSPQRADDRLLKAASDLANRFNLPIHSHLLETKWQKLSADHDISPVLKLDQYGLLGKQTSLAHGIWLEEYELDLIGERSTTVVSNPTSNSFLGSGFFPVKEYIKRNIPIALGSDGVNCGTNNNMLDILRFFMLLQRPQEPDFTKWISVNEGFQMITNNGYRLLGFDEDSVKIRENNHADLVVVDKGSFLEISDDTILNQLIFNSSITVKHVLINGSFAMKDRVILAIDEEALKEEISSRKDYLKKNIHKALNSAIEEKNAYANLYQSITKSNS